MAPSRTCSACCGWLGVPLFLWLLLGPQADVAAAGRARGVRLHRLGRTACWPAGWSQYSRLGELLDPAADRLYILAALIGLVLRHIIPWWLAAAASIGRDLVLALTLPVLRRHGYGPPQVHYLGKAATFALLYAFPLLLLASGEGTVADIARPIAWAFTIWGTALYLWSGVLYLWQCYTLVRADRAAPEASAS